MTKKETAQILAIVMAVYPNTKIEDPNAMIMGWHMVLGDYPAESIMRAARLHMSSSKYFPTPAEISEKIIRAELLYGSSQNVARIQASTPKQLPDGEDDDILQICED